MNIKKYYFLIKTFGYLSDGKDTSKKGMHVEAIVGGSVGGAMIVLGAAAFAFVLFKKTVA